MLPQLSSTMEAIEGVRGKRGSYLNPRHLTQSTRVNHTLLLSGCDFQL